MTAFRSGFTPIPEIARDDADVSLIFLTQNSLAYTNPVDDPFFAAHETHTPHEVVPGDINPLYCSDNLVSVMGCMDQHRICNPTTPDGLHCTSWGISQIFMEFEYLGLNNAQSNTAFVILRADRDGVMSNSITG